MQNDDVLKNLLESYDADYPEPFSSGYDIMECLSEHNGISTFLVQDHSGGKFIAKCFTKSIWKSISGNDILTELSHKDLPEYIATYENDLMTVIIREYVEGQSLDRLAADGELLQQDIVGICVKICDILAYLHHREAPVIHRDIKPQNIIIRPDGSAVLIDFDIARVHNDENDTDTVFFGTRNYAPPEQYGFSQTDARTDIYSLGILLRWLLTGSTKENKNIKVYKPLEKIIDKCTAFSPKERYSDVSQVKKALETANPRSQGLRAALITSCAVILTGILVFAGVRIYQIVTYTPFRDDIIPACLSDEERMADAVFYMKNKYGTSMFDVADDIATVGDMRKAMMELYGLDHDYVYGFSPEIPSESDNCLMPWGWDDTQTLEKDIAIYVSVKIHDPAIVADWSELKDDNGSYPGVRVATAFADKVGLAGDINRPGDLTMGEMAVILADADRIFESTKE